MNRSKPFFVSGYYQHNPEETFSDFVVAFDIEQAKRAVASRREGSIVVEAFGREELLTTLTALEAVDKGLIEDVLYLDEYGHVIR